MSFVVGMSLLGADNVIPFTIRFINREGIDFSDAQSMQAVQVCTFGGQKSY